MPYVKPETLLALQQAAQQSIDQETLGDGPDRQQVQAGLSICPVCGDVTCGKKVVQANGVYVHPEDVAEADVIGRPGQ